MILLFFQLFINDFLILFIQIMEKHQNVQIMEIIENVLSFFELFGPLARRLCHTGDWDGGGKPIAVSICTTTQYTEDYHLFMLLLYLFM